MPRIDMVILNLDAFERARLAKFYSLPELSNKARLSDQTIRHARAGRAIGLASAKKIAKALGLELSALSANVNPSDRPEAATACA